MKGGIVTVVLGYILLAGCAGSSQPVMVPMEIQNIQSREFKEGKNIVFPAVVSVFQDLGYNIKAADLSSGFINAESPASTRTKIFVGRIVGKTIATAFIEGIGTSTRVRLNFMLSEHAFMGLGEEKHKDEPVLDATVYANAYERIESAIFLRTSR